MKKIILMITGLAITSLTMSQTINSELVSSAGDSFENSNYQIDWSIGELATETFSNSQISLTQGFHQGNYIVTTIKDLRSEIEISVYPNPTSDYINLNFAKISNFNKVNYTVTDINGKIITKSETQSDIEQINFSDFAAGTYLISVTQNNQLLKSFKVIKN